MNVLARFRPLIFVALIVGLLTASPAFFVPPVLADQPAPPPGPDLDEAPHDLKGCDSLRLGRADKACDVLNRQPMALIPPATPTGYIKSLYITYYGLGSDTHRTRVQDLARVDHGPGAQESSAGRVHQ